MVHHKGDGYNDLYFLYNIVYNSKISKLIGFDIMSWLTKFSSIFGRNSIISKDSDSLKECVY